jgi:hypothetical protein
MSVWSNGWSELSDLPLAKTGRVIDDRLGAADVTEALAPAFEHLIGCLRVKATNVNVGLTTDVLQSPVKRLQRRAGCWNGLRDWRLLAHKHVKTGRDAAVLSHLGQRHAVRGEDLSWRRRALSVHAAGRTVDDSNTRAYEGVPGASFSLDEMESRRGVIRVGTSPVV